MTSVVKCNPSFPVEAKYMEGYRSGHNGALLKTNVCICKVGVENPVFMRCLGLLGPPKNNFSILLFYPFSVWYNKQDLLGEMAEWLKAPVLKTCDSPTKLNKNPHGGLAKWS